MRLEQVLGGGDAGDAGVDFHGGVEGAGEAFEDGFGHVVGVAAVEDFDVDVSEDGVGEAAEEFFDELEGEEADGRGGVGDAAFEERAAAEVDGDAGEGFVHGEVGPAVADDAAFVAEGVAEGLAEDDAGVFDGVVEVDVEVALRAHREVHETMLGEEREHVVEEADACLDIGAAGAVDGDREGDIGFRGLADDGGGARAGHDWRWDPGECSG